MEKEYRVVSCFYCLWRDFYRLVQSYPPRCPDCGSGCDQEFVMASFPPAVRRHLGKDRGVRAVLSRYGEAVRSKRGLG